MEYKILSEVRDHQMQTAMNEAAAGGWEALTVFKYDGRLIAVMQK